MLENLLFTILMLIDTHCHLDCTQLADQLDQILNDAQTNNLKHIITIGCDPKRWQQTRDLCEAKNNSPFSILHYSLGVHPCDAYSGATDWVLLEAMMQHDKCVALGETGVDLHWADNPSLSEQYEALERHIALSKKTQQTTHYSPS